MGVVRGGLESGHHPAPPVREKDGLIVNEQHKRLLSAL